MVVIAALIFIVVIGCLGLFQLALVLGAPLGRFAWGGQHKHPRSDLRIGSAIAIPVYLLMVFVVVAQAGLVSALSGQPWLDIAIWAIVAFSGVSVLLNGISRSLPERFVMTPVAATLLLTSLFVAMNT